MNKEATYLKLIISSMAEEEEVVSPITIVVEDVKDVIEDIKTMQTDIENVIEDIKTIAEEEIKIVEKKEESTSYSYCIIS